LNSGTFKRLRRPSFPNYDVANFTIDQGYRFSGLTGSYSLDASGSRFFGDFGVSYYPDNTDFTYLLKSGTFVYGRVTVTSHFNLLNGGNFDGTFDTTISSQGGTYHLLDVDFWQTLIASPCQSIYVTINNLDPYTFEDLTITFAKDDAAFSNAFPAGNQLFIPSTTAINLTITYACNTSDPNLPFTSATILCPAITTVNDEVSCDYSTITNSLRVRTVPTRRKGTNHTSNQSKNVGSPTEKALGS